MVKWWTADREGPWCSGLSDWRRLDTNPPLTGSTLRSPFFSSPPSPHPALLFFIFYFLSFFLLVFFFLSCFSNASSLNSFHELFSFFFLFFSPFLFFSYSSYHFADFLLILTNFTLTHTHCYTRIQTPAPTTTLTHTHTHTHTRTHARTHALTNTHTHTHTHAHTYTHTHTHTRVVAHNSDCMILRASSITDTNTPQQVSVLKVSTLTESPLFSFTASQ